MATTTNPKSTYALYVGDLAPDVVEVQLFETFGPIGDIVSVRICRDLVSSKSLGYGYVNYASPESAEKALRQLNFTPIKGRPCRIMRSNPEPTKRRTNEGNLVVKNVDKKVSDRQFFEFFSNIGTVASCKISKDASGESRGYGFVHFDKEEDAKKVLSMVTDKSLPALGDKVVEVEIFVNRNERVKVEVPATNLYIKNFPASWTKEMVEATFGAFGELTSVHITTDVKERKFAFVNLATPEAAAQAIAELNGRICKPDGGVKAASEETEEEKAVLPVDDFPAKKEEGEEDESSAEETAAAEEATPEETPAFLRLYVSRAQSRSEREATIRAKFAALSGVSGADKTKAEANPGMALYVKNLPESCTKEHLRELFGRHGVVQDVFVALAPNNNKVCRGFGVVTMADKESATRAMGNLSNSEYHGKPLHVCVHQKREERARIVQEQQQIAQQNGHQMQGNYNQHGFQRQFNNYRQQQNNGQFGNRHPNSQQGFTRPARHHNGGQFGHQQMRHQQANPNHQQMQQQMLGTPMAPAPAVQQKPDIRAFCASLEDNQRREYLGNLLYPRIASKNPQEAAKITGMILEMGTEEIVSMIEDASKLEAKIAEAVAVLEQANRA